VLLYCSCTHQKVLFPTTMIILLLICFGSSSFSQRNKSYSLSARTIKDFTKYSLVFVRRESILSDKMMCQAGEIHNDTSIRFMSEINMCGEPGYFPRILATTQVSWKRNRNEDKFDDDSSDSSGKNDVTKRSKEIVHKYLVFALLLPRHPFSAELYHHLSVVAPMFPSITVVYGNGYHFQELCTQYGVRSFPKLLLFNNGTLTEKYSRKRSPEKLAAYFSKWSNSLPRSIPVEKDFALDPHPSLLRRALVDKLIEYRLHSSQEHENILEPTAGLMEPLSEWDSSVFVCCSVYAIVRLGSLVYSGALWRK